MLSLGDASGNTFYGIYRCNEKTLESVALYTDNSIRYLSSLSLLTDTDGKEKIAAWVQMGDGYNGPILMDLDGSNLQRLN